MPAVTHGVFHSVGGSAFTGTIAIGYLSADRLVIVDEEYSGKRVGTCEYPQPTK